MSGKCTTDLKRARKLRIVAREHEIISHFLWNLLSLPAYNHLTDMLGENEDAQKTCGSWMKGQKPTEKLVAWCRDQWQRMQPVRNYAQACEVSSPIVMRPSTCLPCCYVCGAICKDYTEDIGKEIPEDELGCIVVIFWKERMNTSVRLLVMIRQSRSQKE